MKDGLHPTYTTATVTCACGNTFTVGSTKAEIHVESCSNCHPFYTGQKKLVDAAGRVERFAKMLEKTQTKKTATAAAPKAKKPAVKKERKQSKRLG